LVVIGFFALVAMAIFILNENQSGGAASSPTGIIGTVEAFVTGNLSAAQIAQYAATAGFTGSDLITAVAVAETESGGDPNAYNPEIAAGTPTGEGSVGLWQIYTKVHPHYTAQQLTDPQTNANEAYRVYSAAGGNFSPWSTFQSGAFMANINAAQSGVAQSQVA